jgi:hypothetical protein
MFFQSRSAFLLENVSGTFGFGGHIECGFRLPTVVCSTAGTSDERCNDERRPNDDDRQPEPQKDFQE